MAERGDFILECSSEDNWVAFVLRLTPPPDFTDVEYSLVPGFEDYIIALPPSFKDDSITPLPGPQTLKIASRLASESGAWGHQGRTL